MPRAMSASEKWNKWVLPEPNSGCLLWIGSLHRAGYGVVSNGSKVVLAHRFYYCIFKGEIPDGLELDHLCRVRCCVNPDHLEPVTRRVNCSRGDCGKVMIGAHKAKTHCPHGHEYTVENTWVYKNGRYCRECHRIRQRMRYHNRRPLSHS